MEILRFALRNIRLALVIFVGVPILIFAGVMAAIEWWSGDGELQIRPSPGETVAVTIDGRPPMTITEGLPFREDLPQGTHHVTIVGPLGQSSFDVAVTNGMFRALVPTSPQQCWLDLDVYDFYYAPSRSLPTIEARYPANAPVPVPGGAHFDEVSLPRSVSEHSSVHMMLPVPCDAMQLPDAQLVAGLGFAL